MRTHRTPLRTLSSLLVLGAIALAPASPALAQPAVLPAPPAPGAVSAPDFDALLAQAQKLVTEERHSEALRLWHAAYTQRQRPELLVHIARAEQRLGLADDALEAYKRYLTAEPNPPPELRTEAEQAIARLSRMSTRVPAIGVQPGPMAMGATGASGFPIALDEEGRAVPLRMVNLKYHNGMRVAGIVLASIGYSVSFIVGTTMGSIYLTGNSSRSSSYKFGQGAFTLLIPVVGPLISSVVVPTTYDKDAGLYWSMPIMFTVGALQVLGVGLWAGAYRHPQRRLVPAVAKDLRIVPTVAPGYAGLGGGFSF